MADQTAAVTPDRVNLPPNIPGPTTAQGQNIVAGTAPASGDSSGDWVDAVESGWIREEWSEFWNDPANPLSKEARAARAEKRKKRAEAEELRQRLLAEKAAKDARDYKNPYYSGVNVGIYIGGEWITHAVTIDYTETVNKSPVYGYMSEHFDAVARGNIIVQGSFVIAYTGADYLSKVLRSYEDLRAAAPATVDVSTLEGRIKYAKETYWGIPVEGSTQSDVVPLRYSYDTSPYNARVNRDGFRISIFFGAGEFLKRRNMTQPAGYTETIEGVHLTSRGMAIMVNGQPIGEQYSFFAKSVSTNYGNMKRLNAVA